MCGESVWVEKMIDERINKENESLITEKRSLYLLWLQNIRCYSNERFKCARLETKRVV